MLALSLREHTLIYSLVLNFRPTHIRNVLVHEVNILPTLLLFFA
jgi:hypothetical protein